MSSPTVVPSPDEWMYDTDRVYISRYSPGPLLVRTIGPQGTPAGPDDGEVILDLIPQFSSPEGQPPPGSRHTASHVGEHLYQVSLSSADTSIPGPYLARWVYTMDGVERIGKQPVMVGGSAPAYDALPLEMKGVVEQVWLRVADQFDSPMGGPHLQVYMQAHFGRNRIAQLLPVAMGRLNTVAQPVQTYSLDVGGKPFPVEKWGALLSQALWVEVIKHLRRSYLEQPNPVGVSVARLDRSAYMNAWGQLLADEQGDLRAMMDNFKMQHMNLGTGSVLVAGGIYPRVSAYGGSFVSHAAPRGLYLMR